MKRVLSICLTALILMSLCACGGRKKEKPVDPAWQEQYDLGIRYLSEGNYEEAIIAFTAAIGIDAKQAGAYTALADVYVAMGASAAAKAILEQGYEATGDQSLNDRLNAMQGNESGASKPALAESLFAWSGASMYEADGTLIFREEITHDENGRPISGKLYEVAADGTHMLQSEIEYVLDDMGRVVEMIQHSEAEGWSYNFTYQWDADGKLLPSVRTFDYWTDEESFEYDENGYIKQIVIRTYGEGFDEEVFENYEWSDDGRLVRSDRYTEGVLTEYIIYEYVD